MRYEEQRENDAVEHERTDATKGAFCGDFVVGFGTGDTITVSLDFDAFVAVLGNKTLSQRTAHSAKS